MTEQMHIWLVQECPGYGEAVVIAPTAAQAKSVADTDACLNVSEHTVITKLGSVGPDDIQQVLPILVLTGRSPYGDER